MTICFLTAMKMECEHMLEESKLLCEETYGFAHLYLLEHGEKKFYLCASGIGKVLAASAVSAIIVAHPEIDAFINVGIGGSLDAAKAPVLSALIASSFVQHDNDTTAFGDPRGFLNGLDMVNIPADSALNETLSRICDEGRLKHFEGVMASGDQFIVERKKKERIMETHDAIMVDMEAAAFAEVCYVYHKPFTSLRIVSDANGDQNEYMKYKPLACSIASEIGLKAVAML